MQSFSILVDGLPPLTADFCDEKLCTLKISKNTSKTVDLPPCAKYLKEELEKYAKGKLKKFSTKIEFLSGTSFQQSVWKELLKIPYEQTRSYQDIAIALGDAKKARAIGGAVNKNPILILVPCHRVIGKNGDLVGFACGLDVKKLLLDIERK